MLCIPYRAVGNTDAVVIAPGYGMEVRGSNFGRGMRFLSSHNVCANTGAHAVSYLGGTLVLFLGVKWP